MQDLNSLEMNAIWAVLGISLLAIAYAFVLRSQVLAQDKGTARMQELWGFIRAGASAYMGRQFRTLALVVVVLTLAVAASVLFIPPPTAAVERFGADQARLWLALGRGGAFLAGSLVSFLIGVLGVQVAVEGSVRVTAAARKGYDPALRIAYRSGAVTGMLTIGLALLGSTLIFLAFGLIAPEILLGFALGGSLTAFFMRVGGGIFVQAAHTGADLVGKIEPGIPAADPRNAAMIADMVGDNTNDCAGVGADTFESFEAILVAALILGLVLGAGSNAPTGGPGIDLRFILFPLLLGGVGIVASLIGSLFVRTDERRRNATAAIQRGFYLAAVIAVIGFAAVTFFFMRDPNTDQTDWRPFLAATVGVLLAVVLNRLTVFFTSTTYSPVKTISRSSRTGPSATILSGMAMGLESGVWTVVAIAVSILASTIIYAGVDPAIQFTAVLYSTALTGIGMLALTGSTVAMHCLGPVTATASQIGRITGLDKNARNVIEDLDAVGNTTRSVNKGLAIGSAVLVSVALFGALLISIGAAQAYFDQLVPSGINLASPWVIIGLLVGGAVPLLFSSLTIRAVTRAAAQMVNAVQQHLKPTEVVEEPGAPDYAQTVHVAAIATQKELVSLGVIGLLTPILIGFLLGVEALGSFLLGVILAGHLLSIVQTNTGGAWHNTRRYIEDGHDGGKHSDAHQAAIVTDTAGGPLKDTSGPSLNLLLKGISLIALIITPNIIAAYQPDNALNMITWGALVICLAILLWAIWQGRRETQQMNDVAKAVAARGRI